MVSDISALRSVLAVNVLFALGLLLPGQTVEYIRAIVFDRNSNVDVLILIAVPIAGACLANILAILASSYSFGFSASRSSADDANGRSSISFFRSTFGLLLSCFLVLFPAFVASAGIARAYASLDPDIYLHAQSRFAIALSAQFLIPILLLIVFLAVVKRVSTTEESSRFVRLFSAGRPLIAWMIFALTIAVAGSLVVVPYSNPDHIVDLSRSLTPLGVFALFFICLNVICAGLVRLYDLYRIPVITLALICAVIFSEFGFNSNHGIRLLKNDRPERIILNFDLVRDWINSRPDLENYSDTAYPIYIISAQGGGIYAAFHTAKVLANLEDQWPGFSSHVFAVSSVSGGSLGAALFNSLIEERHNLKQCENLNALSNSELVDKYFSFDFLSAPLFMATFPDFFQRFWPVSVQKFDRSLGLEYSFEQAWDRLIGGCKGNKIGNPFRNSASGWNTAKPYPALIMNTTRHPNGQPVTISKLFPRNYEFVGIWDTGLNKDISLSTAVGISARFPYISPLGRYSSKALTWEGTLRPTTISLADGGYYDSSGATNLTHILLYLKRTLAARRKIDNLKARIFPIIIGDASFIQREYIYQIAGARQKLKELNSFEIGGRETGIAITEDTLRSLEPFLPDKGFVSSIKPYELGSPLVILYGARAHRAADSVKRLIILNSLVGSFRDIEGKPVSGVIPRPSVFDHTRSHIFPLSILTENLPLGWWLSESTRQRIALRLGDVKGCPYDVPFPRLEVPPDRERFLKFMESNKENIVGGLDYWMASCSVKEILKKNCKRDADGISRTC